jgi:hypothetical protein
MGSICGTSYTLPTIAYNLLNHTHTTSILYYHEYLGNYTVSQNIPYVLGETNSVSCQGLAGVSDVFAASLWSVDYIMYIATLHVQRVFFHMGTPYRYSAWQPIEHNGTAAGVKALYYGNLFTARALAGGGKKVTVLVNETSFTAYGIWDSPTTSCQQGGQGDTLTGLVVVNMQVWNSTMAGERPYEAVQLPDGFAEARVLRMTSPGVDVAENITVGGQWVGGDGTIMGALVEEKVNGVKVLVGAGEAVLVQI